MERLTNEQLALLEPVKRASDAIAQTDTEIASALQRIDGIRARCQPLHGQVQELLAQQPMDIGPDPDHVDALLADPAATPDIAAITKTISTSRKAEDVRQMAIVTVRAAIAKLEEGITVIEAEIAALRARRQREWGEFVDIGADRLAKVFSAVVQSLISQIMVPFDAMNHLKDDAGQYILRTQAGRPPRFSHDTKLSLENWDASRNAWISNILFEAPRYRSPRDADQVLADFRALLTSPSDNEVPAVSQVVVVSAS